MANSIWTQPPRRTQQSVAQTFPTSSGGGDSAGSEIHYVIEGESASSAQTSLVLKHGGYILGPSHPAIPVPTDMTSGPMAVSFMAGSDPGGPWTFTFQKRAVGAELFVNVATAEVELV